MIDYTRFKFRKPGSKPRSTTAKKRHRKEKSIKRKTQAEVIEAVRRDVFQLDVVCAVCYRALVSDADEMHEIIPRSKTRGLPPEQRFNVKICIRLHSGCHQTVTGNRIKLQFVDPLLGIRGGVRVLAGDKELWIYKRGIDMSNVKTKPTTATVKKPMSATKPTPPKVSRP